MGGNAARLAAYWDFRPYSSGTSRAILVWFLLGNADGPDWHPARESGPSRADWRAELGCLTLPVLSRGVRQVEPFRGPTHCIFRQDAAT